MSSGRVQALAVATRPGGQVVYERFYDALDAVTRPVELPFLAQAFASSVAEAAEEGASLTDDPAILLLGTCISFHTHADVNTDRGINHLIGLCCDRIGSRSLQ